MIKAISTFKRSKKHTVLLVDFFGAGMELISPEGKINKGLLP